MMMTHYQTKISLAFGFGYVWNSSGDLTVYAIDAGTGARTGVVRIER
jgi:hypothetical protein